MKINLLLFFSLVFTFIFLIIFCTNFLYTSSPYFLNTIEGSKINLPLFKSEKNITNDTIRKDSKEDYKRKYDFKPGVVSSMQWEINKTGAEADLDVTYEFINETATLFCIKTDNKTKYKEEAEEVKSRKIKEIPVSKIKGQVKLDKSEINFDVVNDSQETCFVANYDNITSAEFKIGWESVIVSSAYTSMWRHANSRILVWKNEKEGYLIYTDGNSDLKYLETSNGGESWNSNLIRTGAIYSFSVWYDKWTSENLGDLIHIAYVDDEDGDDVHYYNLNTTNNQLSSKSTIFPGSTLAITGVNDFDIVKSRGNMIYVGGTIDTGVENFFYNSSDNGATWSSKSNVNEGDSDRIIFSPCNEPNPNDICAIYLDISVNDLTIKVFNSTSNSWSESSILENSITETDDYFQMDATYRHSDNHTLLAIWEGVYIASPDPAILFYDITDIDTYTKKTDIYAADNEPANIGLMIDQQTNNIYAAYTVGSTSASDVYYKNSSDGGSTWSSATLYDDHSDDIKGCYAGTSIGNDGGRFAPVFFNDDLNNLYNNYSASVIIENNYINFGGGVINDSANVSQSNIFMNITLDEDISIDELNYILRNGSLNMTGMVGYWNFNRDHNGRWIDGQVGRGLEFDGTGDNVDTGDWSNSLDYITVSAWVKPRDAARGDIVSKWASAQRQYNLLQGVTSGKFQFYISRDGQNAEGSGNSLTTISPGNWYHVVGTYNGSSAKIYVNGLEENSTDYSGTLDGTSTENNFIGKSSDATFNGSIDEVMIFNRSLTATEISDLYNNQSNGSAGSDFTGDVNLVGYWSFNRTMEDFSGEDNDGVPTGFEWSAHDFTDNDNNGTYNSNAHTDRFSNNTENYYRDALVLDGTDDYVLVQDDDSLSPLVNTNEMTISGWIYPRTTTNADYIITKGNEPSGAWEYGIRFTSNQLRAFVWNSIGSNIYGLSTTTTIPKNTWSHFAFTVDHTNKTISAYYNGVFENSTANSSAANPSNGVSDVAIGRRNGQGYFDGSIDEILIYNRSLSASEISDLYNSRIINKSTYKNRQTNINVTGLNTGKYFYYVDVLDTRNFYDRTEIRNINLTETAAVDNPPTSILSRPPDDQNYTNSTIVTFECNATDDNGLVNVTLYVWDSNGAEDHTNYSTMTGTDDSKVFTRSFSTDDQYEWNCIVFDDNHASDWGTNRTLNISESLEIVPDSTNPNVTINTPLNQSYSTNTIEFNVTSLDETGMGTCWYSFDIGSNNHTMSNSGNEWTDTNTTMQEGGQSVNFYCNDSSGNINNSESVDFFIDSIAPTITIDSPTNQTYGTKTIDLNVSANENIETWWYTNNSGANNNTFTPNVTRNWEEVGNTIIVYGNDSTGNIGSNTVSFNIDTTKPYFTSISNESYYLNQSVNQDIDADDENTGVDCFTVNDTTNFQITCAGVLTNITGLSAQSYFLNITVNDSVNNINSSVINITMNEVTVATLDLEIVYPTNLGQNFNATRYEFFNVTVNVTCRNENCGIVNVSLDPISEWCYQESANVSTGCGGLNTGNYSWDGASWTDLDHLFDGDWDTEGYGAISHYLYINYTKPTNSTNESLWLTKETNDIENLTIFSGCWNQDILQFRVYPITHLAQSNVIWACYNGSDYETLKSDAGYEIMSEEAMWWALDHGGGGESSKSGLISTVVGTTPFYTNVSNPYNVTLNKDETATIVFWVNATGTVGTTHTFYAFANLTSNLAIGNKSSEWTVNITEEDEPVDNEYPVFSNYQNDTANNTEYAPNLNWGFNVSVISTNGNVGLEFNGINYTANNLTEQGYNVTIKDLGAGTYDYYWWAYGNGTDTNFNRSSNRSYTIAVNNSFTLTITGTSPIEYPAETDVSGTDCPSQLTCTVDKLNITYGVGESPVTFNYSTNGNNNYTANSTTIQITINQNSSLILGQTRTSPITYGTSTDFAGTGCPSELSCSLNISNIVFEAGTRYSNYSTAGNENYTAVSNITFTTINQAIPEGSLTNDTALTRTWNGVVTNIGLSESNGGDSDLSYMIYKDNVNVGSSDIEGSVGTYNYVLNTTGGANWTSNTSMNSFTLTINQESPSVEGYINGSRANFTTINGTNNQNLYINATLGDSPCIGTGSITINGTNYNTGTLPLFNYTNLSIGLYNITFTYDGNTNCSSDTEVWWVNVSVIIDSTKPHFTTIPSNASIDYLQALEEDFDGTDDIELDSYTVNDTRFSINSSGGLVNNTILGVGTYILNITINDTSNNLNSTLYQVDINQIVPTVYTYINNSRANLSIANNTQIWLNGTLNTGDSGAICYLYNNGTQINTGTNHLSNYTLFNGKFGLYNITTICDASQNYTRGSETWYVNVTEPTDTTLPSISITTPINNTNTTDNGLDVNYTASDDIALSSCWWSNNSGSNNYSLADCSTNITGETWDEGSNTIIVYVKDTNNNINSSSVTFTVDTTPPSFDDIYNVSIYQNQSVNEDFNASDSGIGFDCWVVNDTTNFNIDCTGQLTNITGLTSMYYYIELTVNDTLNNDDTTTIWINVSDVLVFDLVSPLITIDSPLNQTYTIKTIDLNVSANENISAWWYSNDSGSSNNTFNPNSTLTWEEGSNTVYVWANDTSGNENQSSITFYIDSLAPTFDNLANQSIYDNQSLSYNIDATDSGIGLNKFSINWTSTFTINEDTGVVTNTSGLGIDQIYYINVTVNDTLGNLNSGIFWVNVTNHSIVDIPPVFDDPRNVTHSVNTSLSENFSASDSDGIDTYVLNDTSIFNISQAGLITNITNLSRVEIHWLNLTVNDTNGDLTTLIFFINITADVTAPSVSISHPLEGKSYTYQPIDLNISTTDDGSISSCWWTVNAGTTNNTFTPNYTTLSGLVLGNDYNLTTYCNDSDNNIGLDSVNFYFLAGLSEDEKISWVYIIVFVLAFGLMFLSYKIENYFFSFLSGILFLLIGIYLTINGHPEIEDVLLEKGIGVVVIGIGMYITILSSLEWMRSEVET